MNRNRSSKRTLSRRSNQSRTRQTSTHTPTKLSGLQSFSVRGISTTSVGTKQSFAVRRATSVSSGKTGSSTVASRRTISGSFRLPTYVGEPPKHYAPGTAERSALEGELKRVRNEVVEIPCVVGGKEIYTGNTIEQVMPSDHKHVIAKSMLS